MDEQPGSEQTWTWPERLPAGTLSQPPSPQPAPPSGPALPQYPQDTSGLGTDQRIDPETSRRLAIRSSIITLTSTLLSALAAAGFHLDEAMSTAIVGVVSSITALVVLIHARRNG